MSLLGTTRTCPDLNINPDVKPVKQQQRLFYPEIMEAIELEVMKFIDSSFIREKQHPDWVKWHRASHQEK